MRKQINGYNNYYIYDNGDVLNISTNKILKGSYSFTINRIIFLHDIAGGNHGLQNSAQ